MWSCNSYELNPDQQLAAFDDGRIQLGFSRPLPADRRGEFEEEVVYMDHLAIALPETHRLAKQKVVRFKSLAEGRTVCAIPSPGCSRPRYLMR